MAACLAEEQRGPARQKNPAFGKEVFAPSLVSLPSEPIKDSSRLLGCFAQESFDELNCYLNRSDSWMHILCAFPILCPGLVGGRHQSCIDAARERRRGRIKQPEWDSTMQAGIYKACARKRHSIEGKKIRLSAKM